MNLKTFLYLLSLILITLKITGLILWSWWMVIIPLITCLGANIAIHMIRAYAISKMEPWKQLIFRGYIE